MSDVNPCLSQDIWFEILKNLPVKTLGKCRCVCKSRRSLVVSPSFMAAHLNHYTRNDANSLILCKERCKCLEKKEYEQCILFRDLLHLKQGNQLHTSVFPFFLAHRIFDDPCFYFVGSVNGLVCLSDSSYINPNKDRVFIWNPVTQKSVKLPKSTVNKQFVVGFGYDCQRNDHRVVKFSYMNYLNPLLVEVYSVQERTWRTICTKYLVDNTIHRVSSNHCFMNGVIHFPVERKGLLLFDVSDETFSKMKLPEELVSRCIGDFGLFEYKGKLMVSHCGNRSWETKMAVYCQIWMKQEYDVEDSWCKMLFVEHMDGFYHVGTIEYLGENEELIGFVMDDGTGDLVSYDPTTRRITELGLVASESTKFSAFSESLALLDQEIDDLTARELEMPLSDRPHFMDGMFQNMTCKDDEF